MKLKKIKCPVCKRDVHKGYVKGVFGLCEIQKVSCAPNVSDNIYVLHTCFGEY